MYRTSKLSLLNSTLSRILLPTYRNHHKKKRIKQNIHISKDTFSLNTLVRTLRPNKSRSKQCYLRSSKIFQHRSLAKAFISSGPREAEEHACNTIAEKKGVQELLDKKVRRPRSAERGRESGEEPGNSHKNFKISFSAYPSIRQKMVPSSFLMNFFIISIPPSFFFSAKSTF